MPIVTLFSGWISPPVEVACSAYSTSAALGEPLDFVILLADLVSDLVTDFYLDGDGDLDFDFLSLLDFDLLLLRPFGVCRGDLDLLKDLKDFPRIAVSYLNETSPRFWLPLVLTPVITCPEYYLVMCKLGELFRLGRGLYISIGMLY